MQYKIQEQTIEINPQDTVSVFNWFIDTKYKTDVVVMYVYPDYFVDTKGYTHKIKNLDINCVKKGNNLVNSVPPKGDNYIDI